MALLPGESALLDADCYVVVDTLRATTTIAALFTRGITEVWAVDEIELARRMAQQHDALLLGEVGGLPPAGFALGNSPADVLASESGRERAVMFTTNGTQALCQVASRGATFAAALVNASAVADAIRGFEHVALVCAGEAGGRRFALEDFAAAAAIARRLVSDTDAVAYDDATQLGLAFNDERASMVVGIANHADTLRSIGLAEDIALAATPDSMTCVPRVADAGNGWVLLRDA